MDIVNLIVFLNYILGFSFGYEGLERKGGASPMVDGLEDYAGVYPSAVDRFPENIILLVASGMSDEALVKADVEMEKWKIDMESVRSNQLPVDFAAGRGKLKTYGVDFKPGNLESGLNNIFYGRAERDSCEKTNEDPRNIISLAQKVGKRTGFITNLNVFSEVEPAFFGHEHCFDPRKSNFSVPSCLLQDAKLNIIFGQHTDHSTQEDQASSKHCFSNDKETFIKKWQKEGFHRILFNSSDLNDDMEANGNVLGLFPNISKENFMTLIVLTKKLLRSSENGYLLVVYLKYPDLMETLDITMGLFYLLLDNPEKSTLNILTSEYACEGVCLEKYTTDKNYDEKEDQETTSVGSLPTQKELEKEKDRELVETQKLKENPGGSEVTVVNTTVVNTAEDDITQPEEKKTQVHSQNPVIQDSFSKESPKLTGNRIGAGSIEKQQEHNSTSQEVKSTFGENVVTMENTSEPSMLPLTLTTERKPLENVEGGGKIEPPHTSEVIDARHSSNTLTTREPLNNLNKQQEGFKAGIIENKGQLRSTSSPSDHQSDPGSTYSFVDNHENKTSTEPSTRRRRELEPKTSTDVPIFASGPMADVLNGVKKQDYLWIFLKMYLCADEIVDGLSICQYDPVINKHFDALLAKRSMKGSIAQSSAPEIFGKYLFAYLILAWVSLYGFYF